MTVSIRQLDLRYGFRTLAVALSYFAGGVIGLSLPFIGEDVTLFWPSTGISVAALVLWGFRYWPGVWLGALATNLWVGSPVWLSAGIACGNTLGPVAAAWLLREIASFDPGLTRKHDVVALVCCAAGAMMIPPTLGTFLLCVGGKVAWQVYGPAWLAWWVGDTVGILVFAPPLLTWPRSAMRMDRPVETAIVAALAVVIGFGVYGVPSFVGTLPLAFLPFPFLIWAGFRLGAWGVSLATAVISLIAVWGTSWGYGPFSTAGLHGGLASLWAFLVTASTVSLAVTALRYERDRVDAERKQFFNLSLEMMCTAGLDGYLHQVNPAFSRVLGYTAKELQSRPFLDFIHPDDVESTQREIERLSRGIDTVYFENRYRCKNGSYRYFAWTAPAPPPGENLLYAIARDVTDSRERERERETLAAIIESTTDMVSMADRDGNVIYLNSAARGAAGIEPDAPLPPTRLQDLYPPSTARRLSDEALPTAARKGVWTGETDYTLSDGIQRCALQTIIAHRDSAGVVERYSSIAHDVTELKRAEQAVLQEQVLTQAVFDSLPGVVYLFDQSGRFVRWNRRFELASGYLVDELAGMTPTDFFEDADRPRIAEKVHEVFALGQASVEADLRSKGGEKTPYYFTGVRVELDGAPHLLGMGLDVSARRQAEETVQQILAGIEMTTGQEFFSNLTNYLCAACEVDYASVGVFETERSDVVRTIAVSHRGEQVENITYELRGTPCANVVGQRLCHYPTGVQQEFPSDSLLTAMGVDSYMGTPLWSGDGRAIGLIVLMHHRPMVRPERTETILKVVASQAGVELERTEAEKALRESEARYRAIVEVQTEFVVRCLPDCTRTFVNEAYARYFGQPRDELIGTSFLPLVSNQEREEIERKYRSLTPANPIAVEQHFSRRADGQWRWNEWTDRGLFDDDGALVEIQAVGRDIHEQKVAEQKLREHEQFLDSLIENAADAIYLHDLSGKILRVNQLACEQTGYSREELTSRFVWDVDAAYAGLEQLGPLWDQLEVGRPVAVEGLHQRKDGTTFPVEVRLAKVQREGRPLIFGFARDVTERKQAEEALRESEHFARKVADTSPVVIHVFDVVKQESVYNSREGVSVLGYTSKEMQAFGDNLLPALAHPDEMSLHTEHIERLKSLADDEVLSIEYRMRHADGAWRWFLGHHAVFRRDEEGDVVQIIGSAIDVTTRKRAEEAVRQSEAQFRILIEDLDVGVVLQDADDRILVCNPAAAAMLGLTEDQLKGVSSRDPRWKLVREDGSDLAIDEVPSISAARTLRPVRNAIIGSMKLDSQQRVWLQVSATPRLDSDGSLVHVLVTLVDVTERKRADEEIRASRWMLRTVLDNIPQGVFWKDRESRYLGCNRVILRAFGFDSPDHLIGKTDYEVHKLNSDQAERFVQEDRKVINQDAPELGFLEQVAMANGSVAWVEKSKIPMHDRDGEVVGLLGTWHDVTEQKQAREAIERSNRMLDALSRSQARFISDASAPPTFDQMLQTLLDVTDSKDGFIAEIVYRDDGRSEVKACAVSKIASKCDDEGQRELAGLEGLYSRVVDCGQPLIANDLVDAQVGCFLGLPFRQGEQLVGMLGLANRTGGYDDELVRLLDPFLNTCASLIVALRNENARQKAEAAIRDALQEKDALLKEVHHRVKNNLQIISSLLNLQAEQLSDPSSKAVFQESQARVRVMALVHETLYRSENFARIDMNGYVESLCDYLTQAIGGSDGRIRVETRIEDVSLDLDRAIPCGLIVNELVSNAMKYAFPNGRSGRVHVSLEKPPGGECVLTVTDDGVGLPCDVGGPDPKTLGLQLVGLLARQLGGKLKTERSRGAMFRVSFSP